MVPYQQKMNYLNEYPINTHIDLDVNVLNSENEHINDSLSTMQLNSLYAVLSNSSSLSPAVTPRSAGIIYTNTPDSKLINYDVLINNKLSLVKNYDISTKPTQQNLVISPQMCFSNGSSYQDPNLIVPKTSLERQPSLPLNCYHNNYPPPIFFLSPNSPSVAPPPVLPPPKKRQPKLHYIITNFPRNNKTHDPQIDSSHSPSPGIATPPLTTPSFTTPPPKSYKCSFENCNMVFDRKYNLKTHYATHFDVRTHMCNICSKMFSRRHDLLRHQKLVHNVDRTLLPSKEHRSVDGYLCGK